MFSKNALNGLLAVGVTAGMLSLTGCGGGRAISHPVMPEVTRVSTEAAPSLPVADTAQDEVEDTLDTTDTAPDGIVPPLTEEEVATEEASGLSRGVQTYDWVWTVKPDFGSRKHGSTAFVTGDAKVVGNIKLKAKYGNSTISNVYAFNLKVEKVNPRKGDFTGMNLKTGLKSLNWRKVSGKNQAIVDAPANMIFKGENALGGILHAEVTDTAGKGKVGDKIQIWFTGSNKSHAFNNTLIFDMTTDSSAGKNSGFINLARNAKDTPND